MRISSQFSHLVARPDAEVTQIKSQLGAIEWSVDKSTHRCVVLLTGEGRVVLDNGDLPFNAPCLIWLPSKTAERLVLNAGSRGMSLSVTEIGIAQAVSVGPVASQIRTILSEPLVKPRIDLALVKRIAQSMQTISEEIESDEGGAQESVKHLLALMFIRIWRLSGPAQREAQPLPRTIALQFLQSVELHLRDHWSVGQYAAEIGVTPDRLNATMRRITGRPPMALIHARIILEAEALLDSSTLQISEIAEELGFSDPGYFSRFYKRITGQSPNHKRRELSLETSRPSYAAWP